MPEKASPSSSHNSSSTNTPSTSPKVTRKNSPRSSSRSRTSSASHSSNDEQRELYVCDYDFVGSSLQNLQPINQVDDNSSKNNDKINSTDTTDSNINNNNNIEGTKNNNKNANKRTKGLGHLEFDGKVLDAATSVYQTRYTLSGNSDGHLCVLIHGFGGFSYMFEPLEKSLEEAGVQVLKYDLAGRGYTIHQKDHLYDLEMYIDQLNELLKALGFADRKYAVIGLSMGATIASAVTVRDSNVVANCLIAPTGNSTPPTGGQRSWSFAQSAFKWCLPVVSRMMFAPSSTGYIKADFVTIDDNDNDDEMPTESLNRGEDLRKWSLGWNSASLEENTGLPLAASAARMPIASFISSCLTSQTEKELLALRARNLPVKLFCGRSDKVINDPGVDGYKDLFGQENVAHETFPGRHCFFIQSHEMVNPKIIHFLHSAFSKSS